MVPSERGLPFESCEFFFISDHIRACPLKAFLIIALLSVSLLVVSLVFSPHRITPPYSASSFESNAGVYNSTMDNKIVNSIKDNNAAAHKTIGESIPVMKPNLSRSFVPPDERPSVPFCVASSSLNLPHTPSWMSTGKKLWE